MTREEHTYNRIYWLGRICVQILLVSQHRGLLVRLIPSVTLTACRDHSVIGFSFEWIAGDINIIWARREFQEFERTRRAQVKEWADKAGLTVRQQELRWGW